MILCFEFSGASDTLGFFLKFYAKDFEHKFLKDSQNLTLCVSGEEAELLKFADTLSQNLPNFISIKSSRVYVSDEFLGEKMDFENPLSNITPVQISAFCNGEILPNENGVFSDTMLLKDGKFVEVCKENFAELLDDSLKNLTQGIRLRDKILGDYELCSLENFYACSALMPTNLTHLPKFFITNSSEQIALASYEKPMLLLRTNEAFRQKFSQMFFGVLAARDIFTYALASEAAKQGVEFLCLKTSNKIFKAVVLDSQILFANSSAYFKQTLLPNEKKSLKIFLSKNYDDDISLLLGKDETKLVNLNLPRSFEELFSMLKELDGGEKLLQNYTQKFSLPSGKIVGKNSFFRLFCLAGRILDFHGDFSKSGEILLANAMDFGGTKGVRIEYKMASLTHFDLAKFIQSLLAFRLAGAGDKNISYGVLENFVLFLSDIAQNAKDEFDLSCVTLCGSLFECALLGNLALKHLNLVIKTSFLCEKSLEN
ncbi:MAG: hypothetical protein K5978_01015 [Campylobacter sp.]|nr:hypothetical protein [Campylobacter sp.]